MVGDLKVGPYSVALLPLHSGPLPEVKRNSPEEPVALLLNQAIAGEPGRDFAGAIREGRAASDVVSYVEPAGDPDEDRALRAAWEEKTGESLPAGAVAAVGMMGRADKMPVSWAALRQALQELQAVRAAWLPAPGPWLFTLAATSRHVTPDDYQRIKHLEEEAAAIDALDLDAEVGREPPELIVRRREFLRQCREAGVFATDYGADREKWLDFWFAARLLALRHAANQLRSWGFAAAGEDPSAGRVSLDYVRHQLWPPKEDGRRWAESGLRLMGTPSEGEQGAVMERVGGKGTMRVWWRRDSDHPMLLAVSKS